MKELLAAKREEVVKFDWMTPRAWMTWSGKGALRLLKPAWKLLRLANMELSVPKGLSGLRTPWDSRRAVSMLRAVCLMAVPPISARKPMVGVMAKKVCRKVPSTCVVGSPGLMAVSIGPMGPCALVSAFLDAFVDRLDPRPNSGYRVDGVGLLGRKAVE